MARSVRWTSALISDVRWLASFAGGEPGLWAHSFRPNRLAQLLAVGALVAEPDRPGWFTPHDVTANLPNVEG